MDLCSSLVLAAATVTDPDALSLHLMDLALVWRGLPFPVTAGHGLHQEHTPDCICLLAPALTHPVPRTHTKIYSSYNISKTAGAQSTEAQGLPTTHRR